jgi:hypothetical protein
MRLPLTNPHAEIPTLDDEAVNRAYCDDLARRILAYERDPRNFLKKQRVALPRHGVIGALPFAAVGQT